MKFIRLFLRMTRYRSALVLLLFMLLGAAWHSNLQGTTTSLVMIAIALLCTYTAATSVNDIADWKIDRINLKGHADRPLIVGTAKKKELVIVALSASTVACLTGFFVNPKIGSLTLLLVMMNVCYSLKPTRVSYRPVLTPFYLVVGYIVIPYAIGVLVVGKTLDKSDLLFLPALYFLFLARISLKDFRDRIGDAENNKPTFILKYGKQATCYLSLSSLLIGGVLLLAAVRNVGWLAVELSPYLLVLVMIQNRLLNTKDKLIELVTIGFGARIGNGMLFILLGTILLKQTTTDLIPQLILYGSITVLYFYTFIEFWRSPEAFQFGNKIVSDGVSKT